MHSSIVFGLFTSLALVSATGVSVYPPLNVSTIDEADRMAWCQNQVESCPLICLNQETKGSGGSPSDNTCDADDLSYSCICSDGTTPNATQYSQTIPFYICQQEVILCVNNCGSDNICGSNCAADKPCGAKNPQPPKSTATAAGSKATPATPAASSGFDSSATATAAPTGGVIKSGSNSLVAFGELYGMAVIVASFGAAIFTFLQ